MMDRFRQAKLSVNILYSNMQIMSMLSMVSNGAGISATAELSIPTSQSNEDRPYALRAITPAVTREIGLAAHSMDTLSPAASAFVTLAGQLQRQGKLASVLNY
jgi:DNA-binding transcriptional LysR family regulator